MLLFCCHRDESAKRQQSVKEHTMNEDINTVIKTHGDSLMKLPGVVGVYAGLKNDSIPCIKVMIEKDDPALIAKIPKSLDGFPVEVEVTGRIEPMNPSR
jgi:hypothetical protein